MRRPVRHPCLLGGSAGPHQALYLFLPDAPGDIVASRTALAAFRRIAVTTGVCKPALVPLVEDLLADVIPWDSARYVRGVARRGYAVDMLGRPESWQVIREHGLHAVGHRWCDANAPAYEATSEWSEPGEVPDRTHYSIRMLRLMEQHRHARTWPPGVFESALYPKALGVERAVALAPGSGRLGAWKRMPVIFWQQLADQLRSHGWRIVWFIGPDESELAPVLARRCDQVINGWSRVLLEHSRCLIGIVNDTCHLHIRAHGHGRTLALFNHAEIQEWAGYPQGVTALDCRAAAVPGILDASLQWCARTQSAPAFD